jgi:DNA/RNA-binding domain of Phe-tRNA-synthetase-like protein
MDEIVVEPHPLLRPAAFRAVFPKPLDESPSPSWLTGLLALESDAPLAREESVRKAVRDLLRHGGYKPTGRGKPSAEYLIRAAGEGELSSINLAVDACNAVSLHSGFPISVVDLDLVREPLRIGIAEKGSSYVFNASGQTIDLGGLLCLFDAEGPCANGVKDSQRSKTGGETTRSLCLLWGREDLGERLERATQWYRELLERAGVSTDEVVCLPSLLP